MWWGYTGAFVSRLCVGNFFPFDFFKATNHPTKNGKACGGTTARVSIKRTVSLGTLLAEGRFPPPAGSWIGHGLFLHTGSCNGLRLHNEAFRLHLGAGDVILDHQGDFSTLFLNDLFVWGGWVTAPQQTTPPNKSWSIKMLEFLGRISYPGPLIFT